MNKLPFTVDSNKTCKITFIIISEPLVKLFSKHLCNKNKRFWLLYNSSWWSNCQSLGWEKNIYICGVCDCCVYIMCNKKSASKKNCASCETHYSDRDEALWRYKLKALSEQKIKKRILRLWWAPYCLHLERYFLEYWKPHKMCFRIV